MEQTKEMKQIIAQIIQDIQEQQSYRAVEAGDDVRVIEDLGFSSLDIAQLVAQIEMETGVDHILLHVFRFVQVLSEKS